MPIPSHDRASLVKSISDVLTLLAVGSDLSPLRIAAIAARLHAVLGEDALLEREVITVLSGGMYAGKRLDLPLLLAVARNLASLAYLNLEVGRAA